MLDLLTPLFLSIFLGNILAVSAGGLTLTYSVMRFANFAHGELITIGAFISYLMFYVIPGVPFYLEIPLIFVVGGLAALSVHLIMYRPLSARKAGDVTLLVGSIGVSITLKYILYILTDLQNFWKFLPNQRLSIPAPGGPQPIVIGYISSFPITNFFLISIVAAAGIAAFLTFFLRFTKYGRFARAIADNPELAQTLGVRTERTKILIWIMIGGFTAIGGALAAPSYFFGGLTPELGFNALFYVFAATILGGRTNFYATLLSAYIVAFASNYGILLGSIYLGIPTSMQPALPFAIIILTLLLKPDGITSLGRLRARWFE